MLTKLNELTGQFTEALKTENTRAIDAHIAVKSEMDSLINLTREYVTNGQSLLDTLLSMNAKLEAHFAHRTDALDKLIGQAPADEPISTAPASPEPEPLPALPEEQPPQEQQNLDEAA